MEQQHGTWKNNYTVYDTTKHKYMEQQQQQHGKQNINNNTVHGTTATTQHMKQQHRI